MAKKLRAQPFVHLHNHSEYSFLDSIIKVKGLGATLRRRGFKAHAMTEHGNINGVFEFVKDLKGAGVKPIVGCEFYIVPDRHKRGLSEEDKVVAKTTAKDRGLTARQAVKALEDSKGVRRRSHVVCLAKNNRGWRKLIRAVELAHAEGFYYFPRIDYSILKKLAPDVVVLTACLGGVPGQLISRGDYEGALSWSEEMVNCFGPDFFVEIQPNDIEAQVDLNPKLIRLAREAGARVIATNDVHYLDSEDFETHDILLALRESQGGKSVLVTDKDRFRYPTNQLYLKSRMEMEKSFTKFHPEIDPKIWNSALDVTLEVAELIEPDVLEYRKGVLPRLKIEDEYNGSPDEKLWALVRDGWKWRGINDRCKGKVGLVDWVDGEEPREAPLKEVYTERVRFEMGEITRLGFSRYFLVIWDLVKWARKNGIRVGPGRGSVGGSLVAFLLGITSLDSVKYHCPFSRFISPDRIDYPDIDLDFAGAARDRIKRYLIARYGRSRVAGISTFGRMKGRLVLKDVGRVHDVPWQKTESITKLVLQRPDGDERAFNCLEDTFQEFPETQWYMRQWPTVVNHAMKLEGNVRQLGVHAAGLVISDEPLRNLVPVQMQKAGKGEYLTGWDKRQVEAIGLLKLDILGIDSLQYIQRCLDLIKERTGEEIEPESWGELDDPEIYRNFAEGNTELVWQMNQFGAIRLLKRLRPDRFDHLVATTSLIRPGPQNAGITDEYVKRRHGEKTKSVHPLLDEILGATHGLMVYQEDVIKIVHDLGRFTWGEADRIRKDIGKKKGVEYLKKTYLGRFVEGAARFEIPERTATKIWNQISEFGQYGFNRAHATGYSILSYWTMYLKIRYPLEFMTAALEAESDAEKRRLYIREAKRLGLTVTAPDVNISGFSYVIDPDVPNTIRAGLVDVKGVGAKTVEKIVAGAPYESLRDFIERSGANKTAIVAFLRIGALDRLVEDPKHVEENITEILKVRTRKKPHLKDKYWNKVEEDGLLIVPENAPDPGLGQYTGEEREKYRLELVSLPPSIHPAKKALDWLTEHCEHITFQPISRFESLFDGEFSSIYHAFIGCITKVNFYEESRDGAHGGNFKDGEKNFYETRIGKVILEDDTGTLTVRTSVAQLQRLGAGNLKVGKLLTVFGHSIGFWKLGAGEIVDLGALMEVRARGGRPEPGTPEAFILRDPFAGFREFLKGREALKTFEQGKRKFRSCVFVVSAESKLTRKKQPMMTICCQDLNGDFRDVVLWPSDYQRYAKQIEPGSLCLLHLKSRVEHGKTRRYFLNTSSGKSPIMPFERYYEANTEGK